MVGFSFARFAPFLIVMRIAPLFILMMLLAGCSGSDGGAAAGSGGSGTGGTPLETGLFGSVQDANGRPLERATVEVAGRRAMTDGNGEFVIASSTIGDTVAKFGADGYLPAVRRVTIADGSPTAAHVILKQHAAAQQLTADTGGTIAGAREAAVTIEPGDLSGSKQTSVTGTVDVYVTPVDPSDGNEVQALTASFDDGVDLLESFGMVEVTIMQGADELDVADGETLEIRIPAPAGTPSSELPESMPLWSLDEETGRWVDEGTLTLDEATNTYVGEVGHLSAWNADRRAASTCITGIAVDEPGDPVPGAVVDTKGVDYSGSSTANTGDDGRFYVPVRKSSRVSVSVVHAAGGGEIREVNSSGEDTTIPPTPGDDRCLDVGTFTIEREVPMLPSCVPMACEDTGNECTVGQCSAETGNCDVTNVADGTECDDGVARCSAGECIDLCEDVECPSDDECVQDGTCDPDDAMCVPGDNEPPDTECDLLGLGDGVCDGNGECVECNNPGQCTDGDQCNAATCDANACGTEPVTDGMRCDLFGLDDGICEGGICVELPRCTEDDECISSNQCIGDGTCDVQAGTCIPGDDQPPNTECDLVGLGDGFCDGNGGCVECNSPDQCGDGNECTADDCGDGACLYDNKPAGTPCSGGVCDGSGTCPPDECMDTTVFSESFESGIGVWSVDNGIWEVGEATAGPGSCFSGSSGCAATVLGGDHPGGQDSRLISRRIDLPAVCADQELRMRFWSWTALNQSTGRVQVAVRNEDGTFGAWTEVGTVTGSSGVWAPKEVDLTPYAGETVRVGFLLDSGFAWPGWYIDDIEIVAKAPVFTGDFESGWGDWFADNGVWEVGEATAGPGSCFSGSSGCAATVLGGDHPGGQDSRLISAPRVLEEVSGDEELRMRFWSWTALNQSTGRVQVAVRNEDGTFGAWTEVGTVTGSSGVWAPKEVDLTPYAGETVRVGFLLDSGFAWPGWYIDDIEIVAKAPVFTGDFESGWGDWFADNGVWEVGEATAGPGSCFSGSSGCAATVLGGDHPGGQDSRLISAPRVLEEVSGDEELRMRFWSWTALNQSTGRVQVAVRSEDGTFGAWTEVGTVTGSSGVWAPKEVDLTPYAGETVRIGFLLDSGFAWPGWYIDDIEIVAKAPVFTGDFESGWGDWFADNGVWEVGEATAGPGSCFSGSSGCAATVLGGDHPGGQDSRLISAPRVLEEVSGDEELRMRFWSWTALNQSTGRVQVAVRSEDGTFGAWTEVGTVTGSSGVWTVKDVSLTAYAGETVRIGFLLDSGFAWPGWYVDDIEFLAF